MSDLTENLRSWAQNEEMIDQYYLGHGHDCNEAADLIEWYELQNAALLKRQDELQAVLVAARVSLDRWWLHREDLPAAMLDLANALRALDGEVKP
jgi:hypothetical protein